MERLPFLVEHGDVVWQVLAATAALAAIALTRWVRGWWERRATARDVAMRAARATAPVEGVATLRGTLRGGRASSVSLLYLRGRRPYYDERAPQLWLDCDGQRVALVGPVRVIRGTRLVSTRDRRSALPDDEPAVRSTPILHRLTALATSVRDGDPVFVTAQLAVCPSGEATGYREATTAWTATPHGNAIEIVAAAPVVRAMARGARRMVATGLAGGALAMAAMWAVGAAAMSWPTAAGSAGGLVPVALGELDALALAAATPGHRQEALAEIEARLATHYRRSRETFALWRAVARLRGGCGAEIAARIAQDEIEGLAQLAKRCDDSRAAGDAFQLLGLFHDAAIRDDVATDSRKATPAEQHIESLIAIRAWGRAVGWAVDHQGDPFEEGLPIAPREGAFECAVEWFERMRDIESADHVRELSPVSFLRRDPVCPVFRALVTPENARAEALAQVETSDRSIEHLANVLSWAYGAPASLSGVVPSAPELHVALFDPSDRMTIARALLSEPADARTRRDSPALTELAVWRSVHKMLVGDIGNARALARYVTTHPVWPLSGPVDHPPSMLRDAHEQDLEIALALRLGTALPMESPDPNDETELRASYAEMYWTPGRDACDRRELGDAGIFKHLMWRIASRGDARGLADLLARCRAHGAPMLDALFAVWPRIQQGRDQLAEVLRRIDLGPPATDPLAMIGRAAMRRDLARLIGDHHAVAAWQEIIDRHVSAFSRERPLIGLVARELLRPAER